MPTLGLNEFAITEGGRAIWKNDSYIDGVAGVADARRDVDWITFNVGSGSYRFELTEKDETQGGPQLVDAVIDCNIPNQMTELGRPESYAIGR